MNTKTCWTEDDVAETIKKYSQELSVMAKALDGLQDQYWAYERHLRFCTDSITLPKNFEDFTRFHGKVSKSESPNLIESKTTEAD